MLGKKLGAQASRASKTVKQVGKKLDFVGSLSNGSNKRPKAKRY